TDGESAVCAAHKHHVGCASPRRHHARQHVNVIISRTTGTINCQETLARQSYSINSATTEAATHVDRDYLIKSGCLAPDLRIARTNTLKRRAPAPAADKKVAVRVYVERPIYRRVRNTDRRLPSYTAVRAALELHAPSVTVNAIVCLVNGDRTLVRGIADNILASGIHVCLVAGEHAELRDHSRRSLYLPRRRRRVIVFFQRLVSGRLASGRKLG